MPPNIDATTTIVKPQLSPTIIFLFNNSIPSSKQKKTFMCWSIIVNYFNISCPFLSHIHIITFDQ